MLYTKTIITEMKSMCDQGFNYKQIAGKYGKSESAIQKAFSYHGLARKNRRITDDEKALIMRTDLKAREIGEMIDMDEQAVRECRYRIRAGSTKRGRNEGV